MAFQVSLVVRVVAVVVVTVANIVTAVENKITGDIALSGVSVVSLTPKVVEPALVMMVEVVMTVEEILPIMVVAIGRAIVQETVGDNDAVIVAVDGGGSLYVVGLTAMAVETTLVVTIITVVVRVGEVGVVVVANTLLVVTVDFMVVVTAAVGRAIIHKDTGRADVVLTLEP